MTRWQSESASWVICTPDREWRIIKGVSTRITFNRCVAEEGGSKEGRDESDEAGCLSRRQGKGRDEYVPEKIRMVSIPERKLASASS